MIIKGMRWFNSVTMEFIFDQKIWVENGQIVEIGKRIVHTGGEVVDLTGMLLLPGWIDTHVHLTLSGESDPLARWFKDGVVLSAIKGVEYLRAHLKAGVVALRDLGGDGDIAIGLRDALKNNVISGPALYTAGKALTMTGGHIHQISKEVDGQFEVCKGAREELKKGVDLLKVIATGGIMTSGVEPGAPQLGIEEIRVIVEEAHNAGKKVSTHVEGSQGILNSLQAGVDTIEHGIGLTSEAIAMMKEKSIPLIPTLAAPRLILKHRDELPSEMVKKAESVVEEHKASFALAYRNGLKIAVGTDAGTPFNRHGDYYLEIEELLKDGMSIEEVLQAASLNGAYVLGKDKLCGNIEEGKMANMTIVDDCIGEKNWYRNIRLVVINGNIFKVK